MDVIIAKKDLIRLIGRTQGVADKKSTMPILSNVLLQADAEGTLRASATDLFLAVSATVPCQVTQAGSLAVPAKDLVERIKAMPDGPVQIRSSEGATAQIKAVGGAREFRLRGMPGEDFPALPKPDGKASANTIAPSTLAELIAKTHFSISTDETRHHLNSALLEWDGDVIRMVTTDGHRLSKHEVAADDGQKASFSLLIPLKGITELRRLCEETKLDKGDKEGAPLRLLRGGPNVFFTNGRGGSDQDESMLAIKLVDAQFPPYQQVIPAKTENAVQVGRLALIDVLRAMSVAASERTGSVKLSLTKGIMRVTSENPDSGDALDEIAVDSGGSDLSIGFNVRYLLDCLNALDDEDVKLGISGELDPVVVEPVSDKRFLGIVMPMRI
ncbi:MAG: DNA polymerase III subunit beta [Polyangiales bacterium]